MNEMRLTCANKAALNFLYNNDNGNFIYPHGYTNGACGLRREGDDALVQRAKGACGRWCYRLTENGRTIASELAS